MSKAIDVTSKYAFEVLGFEKFQIIAHKTNIGSCKVAEKCNFDLAENTFEMNILHRMKLP